MWTSTLPKIPAQAGLPKKKKEDIEQSRNFLARPVFYYSSDIVQIQG